MKVKNEYTDTKELVEECMEIASDWGDRVRRGVHPQGPDPFDGQAFPVLALRGELPVLVLRV